MQEAAQIHPLDPVWDAGSRILILGSFPSVRSRETGFYYGHPSNRFWCVLAALLGCEQPRGTEEKERMLRAHGIALWDVVKQCRICGSSDSSIREVVPNDLREWLERYPVRRIYTNGQTADRLYRRYLEQQTGMEAYCLPSTSPANARLRVGDLVAQWRVILQDLTPEEDGR